MLEKLRAGLTVRVASVAVVLLNGCGADPDAPGLSDLAAAPRPIRGSLSHGAQQRLRENGAAPVLIALHASEDAEISRVQRDVLARLGADFEVRHRFVKVPALAGILNEDGLDRLRSDPSVAAVQLDDRGSGHLTESVPLLGASTVHSTYNLGGQGVRVAVLDSGASTTHPDLSDALIAQQCFTDNDCAPGNANQGTSAEDENGHGSNVTGIITSNGTVSPGGFAPDSEIVAVRVLDTFNEGFVSDWVAGLDWVLTNLPTLQVRVINMSLGTFDLYPGNCDADQPVLANAVAQLAAAGVVMFASTGNQGSSTSIASPACNTGVIAVGATYDGDLGAEPDTGTYQASFGPSWPPCSDAPTSPSTITCFTNSSAMMDLVAPGAAITSAWLGADISTYWGTSQASPTAAGIAALLLQCDPALTPDQIEAALKQSGPMVSDPKNGLAFPSINALAAILGSCPLCAGQPDGAACDDGDACTQVAACQADECVGSDPIGCVAQDSCHDAGTCEPTTGLCSNPTKPEGSACDDGDMCTTEDTCNGAGCAGGAALSCDDGDDCTTDSCVSTAGCLHTPIPGCGGAGGAGGASPAGSGGDPAEESGCDCRVGRAPSPAPPAYLAAVLVMAAIARRRRGARGQ